VNRGAAVAAEEFMDTAGKIRLGRERLLDELAETAEVDPASYLVRVVVISA
jgi:hypothetical protein